MTAHAGPPALFEEVDNWDAYQLRLESYVEVHDIADENKHTTVLVRALSTKTAYLLAARCTPVKIQDLKYADAMNILGERFDPAGKEMAGSYKFITRNQLARESANEFIV
ncbi:hypothetical protein MRX96_011802 [Rhipicephalus microplus]